jgi:acetyl esterase/lipase
MRDSSGLSLASRLLPLYFRVTRANRKYVDPAAARRLVEQRRTTPAVASVPSSISTRFSVQVDTARGWPVYRIAPRSSTPRGAVVYLHGGSWVNEIAPQHWQLIGELANGAKTTVIVPLYPLVPHGTAKTVVDAVIDLTQQAIDEFGTAAIAGDSAGGQLALSTALALRDRHGITLPATILIAPALDLSMSNPDMGAVQPKDPWLAMPGMRVFIDEWRAGLPLDDPQVSPLAGDLAGLGPLTMYSGTRDILNPDGRLLVDRAREAEVSVEFHERAGLLHVYPLTPTPEGAEARREIVATVVAALHS